MFPQQIAIKSWLNTAVSGSLKRDVLIFDRITIYKFVDLMRLAAFRESFDLLEELEWLCEAGIVVVPESTDVDEGLTFGTETPQYRSAQDLGWEQYCALMIKHANGEMNSDELSDGMGRLFYEDECQVRIKSVELRELHGVDVTPLIHPTVLRAQTFPISKAEKQDVVGVVVNALPVPDGSVSWEQIVEYRSDPDSVLKFLRLKNWINEVAKQELALNEVQEKLEWLLREYKKHLDLHRIKTNVGSFEALVVSTTEVVENLVTFRWSTVAKNLFGIKRRRIELLEGELKLPGSEIAYIIDARAKMSRA